jgi:3D (Asp-Asp-Asp) domain-containing protein
MFQIPKCLNLAIGFAAACFLASCAQQSQTSGNAAAKANVRRMQHVRTTAYTHTERGGRHNALDKRLAGHDLISAASDWSHFPLGTRFRIVGTKDEYIIDDYGTALIGTNTIDLYKPTRLQMKRWGVRHVDIDIVQWGSEEESLKVLGPRKKHRYVRQMVGALQKKKSGTVATR